MGDRIPDAYAFVSHISEEAPIAATLKEAIERDFLGNLAVFVSSDGASIAAGEEWLKSIKAALEKARLVVALCSPASVRRPWINFEIGAAWGLECPIIPLCHAGLTTRDLPMPLSLRQGIALDDPEGLRRLYFRISEVLGCRVPARSFDDLASTLTAARPISNVATDTLQQLDRERAARSRLQESLRHPDYEWRSLGRLAVEAALSEEVAADLLRSDPDVRFSKGRSGKIIVGLRSRVR
jgi:hypothetical protein